MTDIDIYWRFTNHPPETAEVGEILDGITETMIKTGQALVQWLPEGREKSLAITKLEECSMWAKAAVARNQPSQVTEPS